MAGALSSGDRSEDGLTTDRVPPAVPFRLSDIAAVKVEPALPVSTTTAISGASLILEAGPLQSLNTTSVPLREAPVLPVLKPVLPPLPTPGAVSGSGKEPPVLLEMSLRSALRDVGAGQIGFDPGKIPEGVRLSLPLDLVRPLVARGRVEIGLEELRAGVLEKYRGAFVRAEEGLRVVVPLSVIFPLLPKEAIPSIPAARVEEGTAAGFEAAPEGAVFVTPFSVPVIVEEKALPPLAGTAPVPPALIPRNGVLSRPPGAGLKGVRDFPALAPLGEGRNGNAGLKLPEPPKLSPLLPAIPGAGSSRISMADMDITMDGNGNGNGSGEENDDDLGEAFSAASLTAEPPLTRGGLAFPLLPPFPARGQVNGLKNGSGVFLEERGEKGATNGGRNREGVEFKPVSVPDGPLEDLSFGCIGDLSQVTLRALFSTDEWLTPQKVVDRCAGLAGLKACVLLRGPDSLSSAGMEAGEAEAFLASAERTLDSLKVLAETMALGEGGNFTLRTDKGIRSFFLAEGLCLAVWHDQALFSAGTREKLILAARELSTPATG